MENFKKDFLASYLSGGMGSLSKRDIDALVMHLLDEQGLDDGVPLRNLSNQQVSVKLRVPATRIKTLRYEATLKYISDNESIAKWRFLEVLAKSKFDSEKDKIGFIIEDAFTKNWLQGILKSDGLVFDNSFNTEVVKVDSDGLFAVLKALYDDKSVTTLKKRIDDTKAKKEKLSFAEIKKEFLKGAASALGESATSVATKGLLALVGG
ncbi:MAG: hypothetical protein Q8O24_08775 [Gallionellaceae bacterium]|nr:hypothetical protein [Gallionellaceae bacterium]